MFYRITNSIVYNDGITNAAERGGLTNLMLCGKQ